MLTIHDSKGRAYTEDEIAEIKKELDRRNNFEKAGSVLGSEFPMIKLTDEACALLIACNEVLSTVAMQGVRVPDRLLNDLLMFTRENLGMLVPFSEIAAALSEVRSRPVNDVMLGELSSILLNMKDVEVIVKQFINKPEDSRLQVARIFSLLAEVELSMQTVRDLFGWNLMTVRMRARMDIDNDPVKSALIEQLAEAKSRIKH